MRDGFEPANLIWDQLVLLGDTCTTYSTLYLQSDDTTSLLARTGGWFFRSHKRLLIRETLLAIARLTDPEANARGEHNLVLSSILKDPTFMDLTLRAQLEVELQSFVADVKPLRIHRHKYLAHLDHEVATGNAPPLPSISWGDIAALVTRAQAIFRAYAQAVDRDVSFDFKGLGDAADIVRRLRDAEKWRLHSFQVMRRTGEPPPDPATDA